MFKIFLLSLIVIVANVSSEKFRFDNYSLFRIVPKNEHQINLLQSLQESDTNYDFWTDPVPKAEFVTIMTSPTFKSKLENFLNFYEFNYEITISNLQEAVEKETVNTYTRNNVRNITWDGYYTLEAIESWMTDLATVYSNVTTLVVGGSTYEGREIKGLKISHGPGRKTIFIESGIHSREWIAISSACYIINELLTSTNEETMAAARDFDWYIFPVTNPDGYVYTHTNFRMWRKNRRPIDGVNFGVDLNRNWNSNWLVSGSSLDPSTDIYAGPGPFSEPETRTLSQFIRSVDNIEMYLSFHSFSQLLLLPFGNSSQAYGNYHDALNIGRRAMGALSVRYGTQYVVGNIAEAIYQATGGSIDWVKDQLNVPLVYCYELRDRGQFGFLLPTDQILPNNQETMDSLLDLIHQARRFGYLSSGATINVSLLAMFMTLIVLLW